jgi:hypothetical protein
MLEPLQEWGWYREFSSETSLSSHSYPDFYPFLLGKPRGITDTTSWNYLL